MKPVRFTATTLAVVRALHDLEGEPYGHQLCQVTGIPSGVVYPILARLESAGWLVSRWDADDSRRGSRRRFYRFTPDGAELACRSLGIEPPRKAS